MAAAMAGAVDLAAVKARSDAAAARPGRAAAERRRAGRCAGLGRRRRHRGHLPGRGARPLLPGAGRARPLGRVVRPVQAALPGARAAGRRGRRLLGAGEGRRRRQPGAGAGAAGAGHPGGQGRLAGPAGRRVHRRDPRGAGARSSSTELVQATTGGALPGAGDGRGRAEAEDPRLDAAEAALERGDLAAAEAAYQAILDAEPDHPEAGLALRQVQLFRRAEEAGPDALAAAEAAPDDVAAQTRAADFLLGTGNVEAAFDRLLDVVRRTAGEDRDQARKHLVELFAVVGDDDPRVGAARRQLTLALSEAPAALQRAEVAGVAALQEAGRGRRRPARSRTPTCSGRPRGVDAVLEQELHGLVDVAGADRHVGRCRRRRRCTTGRRTSRSRQTAERVAAPSSVDRPGLVAHGQRVGQRQRGRHARSRRSRRRPARPGRSRRSRPSSSSAQ